MRTVAAPRDETLFAVLRLLGSCAAFLVLLSVAGWALRDELSQFGHWFVDRFGVGGLVLGSFLADGFHFPVPPQFYMWTGIAGGQREAIVVTSVLVGSELGGLAAFALARLVGRWAFLGARIARPRELLARHFERRGYRGLAVAALLPVSYCLLCMAAGAMCLPFRAYAVIAAMRVPRIIASYVIVVAAWPAG